MNTTDYHLPITDYKTSEFFTAVGQAPLIKVYSYSDFDSD